MERELKVGYNMKPRGIWFISLCTALFIGGVAHAAPQYTLTCSSCHGMPPLDDSAGRVPATGAFKGNHLKHLPASATVNNNGNYCLPCHNTASYNTSHMTGQVGLQSNINNSPYPALGGRYMISGAAVTFKNQTSNPVLGTCATVNCHFEAVTPQWGSADFNAKSNCQACHSASTDSTSHAKHFLYYSTNTGRADVCAKCHPNYASPLSFQHATSVGNRIIKVQITGGTYSGGNSNYLPSQVGRAFGTCSTIYCHSNGTGGSSQSGDNRTIGSPNVTPNWGTSLPADCSGCHTGGITTGPAYVSGTPKMNSHAPHTLSTGPAYTCDYCHYGTTTNGTSVTNPRRHVNGFYNVSANTTKTGAFLYAYNVNGSTCSNSRCHGQGIPTWGATAAVPVNGFPFSANTCDTCHASMTAVAATGGNFYSTAIPKQALATDPQVGAHFNHLSSNANRIGVSAHCNDCHIVPSTVKSAGHMDGSPVINFSARSGVQATYSSATSSCSTYCHGATLSSNKIATGATLAALVPHPRWNNDALLTATVKSAPTPSDCGKCHGFPPQSNAHSGYATKPLSATAASNCNGCHKHFDADAKILDPSLHINGTVEGGSCLGCHSAYAKDTASTKARDAAASYFNANSHHIQGRAVTNADCYICHMEADATGNPTTQHEMKQAGTVDLVVWSAGVRSATYVKYTSSGNRAQLLKLNTHCLGCHSAGGATSKPFNDGKTPQQYAWDGRSIAERYSQPTGTTRWSQYSTAATNKKKHVTKAFSAHGNAANNQMGWNTTTGVDADITNITGNINVLCFDCHNSHGSNVAGKTVSYATMSSAKYNGGIFKDISSSIGGYTATYKPKAGGNTAGKNVYNPGAGLCFDCHNNANANSTRPWGYSTFGATSRLYGYWDTPYFGNYTFASTKRFPFKAGTANAKGKNAGGHYSASSTMATTPAQQIGGLCTPCHDPHGVSPTLGGNQQYAVPLLKGTWVTSPYKEDAPPASATLQRGGGSKIAAMAYGSNSQMYMDQNTLKPNRNIPTQTSQVVVAFGNFTNSASKLQNYSSGKFAGLCFKCHSKASLNYSGTVSSTNWKSMTRVHNSVAGWAATGGGNASNKVHAYTCSKCHAPHNSRLPRLLVTNCLNFEHRGQVVSGGTVASGTPGTNTAGNLAAGNSTGAGAGRFPSGGARYTGNKSVSSAGAKYPGPWMFGTTQTSGGSATTAYTTNCHSSATSGGATWAPANQRWNNVSPW